MSRKPLSPALKLTLLAAGAVLLLVLNFRRDLTRSAKTLRWSLIEKKTLHRSVSSPGVMEAIRVAPMKSEVNEVVIQKFVEEGQAVKTGDPLLELSRARTILEYEQRKNAFNGASQDYAKAQRELRIQKRLFRDQAVAQTQVEEAERNLLRTKASRDMTEREFALAQKKLDGTMVRSPIDGVILKDNTKIGDEVSVGKELILVGDVSRFLVRTKVDELDIKQVSVGQRAEILADAYPGQPMEGQVKTIATQAEREAFAKVEVLLDITDSKDLALKHNLSVRVNILTERIPDAIGVPVRSVQRKDGDRAWILVQNKLGIVVEREVKVGRPAGDEVEVLDGLTPGEKVGYFAVGGR